jgi:hypothetical protein
LPLEQGDRIKSDQTGDDEGAADLTCGLSPFELMNEADAYTRDGREIAQGKTHRLAALANKHTETPGKPYGVVLRLCTIQGFTLPIGIKYTHRLEQQDDFS